MVEEKVFDKTRFVHIETGLKTVTQMNYDLCIHKCNEGKAAEEVSCKQYCYDSIMTPFNMLKHEARSPEEVLYK